jgi:hypothetical protein
MKGRKRLCKETNGSLCKASRFICSVKCLMFSKVYEDFKNFFFFFFREQKFQRKRDLFL